MDKKTKQNLLVTVTGVSLFVVLIRLPAVLGLAGKIIELMLPVIAGGILALFISVPANGVKKQLKKLWKRAKKQPTDQQLQNVSLIFTISGILLVFLLVLLLLVPEISRSLQSLTIQVKASIPGWLEYLKDYGPDSQWVEALLAGIDVEKVMENVSNGADLIFGNLVGALSFTVNMIVTGVFAVIICIYMLLERERLGRHARKLAHAYLKSEWENRVLHFCTVFHQAFTSFLSSQCWEAVILGAFMFLAFVLFRLPYGSLVGLLTAVCAIIPYVGALISCAVSVFLTLLIAPSAVFRCLVVYLVVQFIENQFIYPRVVGGSVGLPPLYTLVAAMVGGKLFGIMGIIFFIPLTAVVIELVKEDAAHRVGEKKRDKA
ncbi:MAG: AI-2E family transporter [Lachnospiraceae bacterium]|jgi:predicted PurR-regulated permease PerM|nr:AI-2E family transporter [Lachnospiraceae bacterium]